MGSHQPTKFGGHRQWKWKCASGNVMVLVCHVIPQGRVAKGSILLVALDTAVVEIQCFCFDTLSRKTTLSKGHVTFYMGVLYYPVTFRGHR